MTSTQRPWMASLHGAHSGEFCDHAEGTLLEILERAEMLGCSVYGVSEHAPRVDEAFLYEEERQLGWTTDRLVRIFDAYAARVSELADAFRGRVDVLRGFECEVVPSERYVEVMLGFREQYGFEFMVGSVHHVGGIIIDYRKDHFDAAVEAGGGFESFAERYYDTYARMLRDLRPEVAAHFDLLRRNAPDEECISGPRARDAAFAALQAVKDVGAILDINTGGYRKGLGRPYPASWILSEARRLEIPVCFGDDSHRPSEVGANFDDARQYLLAHGYNEITVLRHRDAGLVREAIALQPLK